MKESVATVIKTGNSYALRVPKAYAERNNLRPGAKVILPDPKAYGGTLAELQAALQKVRIKAWDKIDDPVGWQQAQRSEWV